MFVKKFILLLMFLALCELSIAENAPGSDLFASYLGTNVSVKVCNQTIVQGVLVNDTADYLVIHDQCTPEVGNVLINKNV